MALSHWDSVLAASCLKTPVNPHTRAPVTLYERQREESRREMAGERQRARHAHTETVRWVRESGSESEDDSESNTEEEQNRMRWQCKDWVLDISKICHSNKEYYMQLEKLKNAHLESMTQLEKMYQNKLHLKGVQSIGIEEGVAKEGFRSAWEPSTLHPTDFDHLHLKHDFNSNASSGLSETSRGDLTDEDCSESEHSESTRERIFQMWNGFSVEDYIRNTDYDMQNRSKGITKRGKSKEWSHRVTIPEPFQMTIRESKKKEMNVKSKSEIEVENNLLKKQLEEEAECQKKFRANPVPASVFLPLYHEIMEKNDERRKSVKEKSKDILLTYQRPFQFIEREERKKEIRNMQLMDLPSSNKKVNHFKAKPVPKSIYGSTVNERLKEVELYRGIRMHMRAQELLRSSTFPTSMLASRTSSVNRKPRCYEPKEEQEHKPNINAQVPNFKALHQKYQKRLLKSKNAKHVTVCDPFYLRTVRIPSRKEKILRDIEADVEHLKETRWPYKSPRCQVQQASRPNLPRGEAPSETFGSTESSKRRLQAIRKSLEEREKLEEDRKKKRAKQKQREKLLKKRVTTRTKANDPHQSIALMSRSKLKELRKCEKQRTKEYFQELGAMEERVSKKPLLLERATQKNARQTAEKHYSNVLRDLGLCEDFVSKKGQTSGLQDHVSDGGERSNMEEEQSSRESTLEVADLCYDDHESESADSEDGEQEIYSSDEDRSEDET
ncbi:protein FAM161A isoform X2 [Ascaphus truei]|uniref:protein FAM161A isoform X2 n=1 Tax=Ascaphus truei TaxID=8439 RepID=UPI003F5A7FA8